MDTLINWNDSIPQIPLEWKASKGKGVKIAILDTGILETHDDLIKIFSNKILTSYDFSNSPVGFNDIDGHGTHVAGLIGGRSSKSTGIIGMAPESIIQNIKVLLDSGDSVGDILSKGLIQMITQANTPTSIDLVNLSLGITYSEYSELIPTIEKLSKSSIIIAAAGENDQLLIANEPLYPAFSSNVISIGAVDSEFFKSKLNSIFHHRVDYLMPFSNLISCSLEKNAFYEARKGSSMSTALLTGIIALLLSRSNKLGNAGIDFVKAELNKIAIPYSNVSDLSKQILIKPKYQ